MTPCVYPGCRDPFLTATPRQIYLNSFQVSFSSPSYIRKSIVDLSHQLIAWPHSRVNYPRKCSRSQEQNPSQTSSLRSVWKSQTQHECVPARYDCKATHPAPRYWGGMTCTPSFLHGKEQCNTNKGINNTSRNSEHRSAAGEGEQL